VIKSDGVTAAAASTNEGTEVTTTTAKIISDVQDISIDHRLIGLKDSIQAVLNEGMGFGIETSIHRVLYLLLTLVEWVLETKSLLCDSCIIRYKTIAPASYVSRIQQQLLLFNCIDSGHQRHQHHHHHRHHDLFEWKCWEYLSSPVQVEDWTDIDIELVRSLIDQGQLLMQYLSYKDSSNEHDGENGNQHDDDEDDERESTGKLTLAIVNNADDHTAMKDDHNDDDDDDDEDNNDGDDINVAVVKNSSGTNNKSKSGTKKGKKKSHTKATNKSTNAPSNTNLSGSKRKKRDSSIGDSISIINHTTAGSDSAAVLPKSTRAMSGISKKKATRDSITKVPTDDPSATTTPTTATATTAASDHHHQSGINSNNTIPSQYLLISHLQGISIDESRLFYVALAYNTLETCSIQARSYLSDASSSSVAIDAMGHMWLQVLKSFESLLSDIKAWSHRADHLLQHYMNHDTVQLPQASSTGGVGTGLQQQLSPIAGSVSVSMRVNEAFEKLLLEAEQKKITNKRR
jgi:hypothetical protein